MAIPSGSFRVSFGSNRPKPFPPAPPKSNRNRIYAIVNDQMASTYSERNLVADSIETSVEDSTAPLQRFVFNDYKFINGKKVSANIKENYLYINGVYVKKKYYTVYEENNNLVVELLEFLGYRIEQNWDITLRIRATSI